MKFEQQDLENLKEIYYRNYAVKLDDQQVYDLAIKLMNLFKVIFKPLPKVDSAKVKGKNKNNG